MQPAYDVYLAGPFFNDEQKRVMDRAKEILLANGLKVCDPRELNGVIVDDQELRKADRLKKIYEDNIEGMRSSWSMFACIDDRDTGTSFELGWFAAHREWQGVHSHRFLGGPIITFSDNGYGCNVMLSQATDLHFASLDELVGPEVNDLFWSMQVHSKSLLDAALTDVRKSRATLAETTE